MNMMMKILHDQKQYLKMFAALSVSSALLLLSTACSEVNDGAIQEAIVLPTDSALNFACKNEGIFEETCVLDNPENPYAKVAIKGDLAPDDDPNDPNFKFNLANAAPSAKARYYVWATALARGAGAQGENQYFTAFALQEVFAQSGSPTTRDQAKNAYRSVLDNYFSSVTFDQFSVGDVVVVNPASLKDRTGENLHLPTDPALVSLYDIPELALQDLGDWGYTYNTTTKIVSKNE